MPAVKEKPSLMTELEGPLLTEIYHRNFHGKADDGEKNHDGSPKTGEANFAEKQAVLNGETPLPSTARIMLDLNSKPDGSEFIPWPTWTFRFYTDDNQLAHEDVISEGESEGSVVRVQAPDRPTGVWQDSKGYRAIFILGGIDFKRGQLVVEAEVGGIESGTLSIPWVAHK
jgi:hypothetical protein